MSISHTLLVTGGAGFIGSCFVGQCVSRGIRPVVLDKLTYAGHRANLEWLPAGSYELVIGDIADKALTAQIMRDHRPGAIVHFAAESHVDNSIAGPAPFIDTNITGTYRLLDSALRYFRGLPDDERTAFRFLNISTDEVYGSLPLSGGHFTETSPYLPNSPYSASKAAGDHLAHAWFHTYGLPVVTTHCSNNYGPRQYPEKLIPRMITCALAGETLPVYGKGENVRDWIHVQDHCGGLFLALERGIPGEVYNFGGRAELSNLALVRRLCALLDTLRPRNGGGSYAQQIGFVTDRPGHDLRYAIDDSKAESQLGFRREYDLERGLKETVEWYLGNGKWMKKVLDER